MTVESMPHFTMTTTFKSALVFATIALASTVCAAESGQNILYLGGGSADSGNPYQSSDPPVTVGYLNIANERSVLWGLDIAGEGTMLESRGARTAVKQGISYNVLFGKNLTQGENTRLDVAVLVGMRRTSSTCPTSYLGYQCYADEPPQISHGFNYGVVAVISYRSVVVGLRATGESAQALLGVRF